MLIAAVVAVELAWLAALGYGIAQLVSLL